MPLSPVPPVRARRSAASAFVVVLAACGFDLVGEDAGSSADAGSSGSSSTSGASGASSGSSAGGPDAVAAVCRSATLTGRFCPDTPPEIEDDLVACVRAEDSAASVALPTGSIAGQSFGGCNDPFVVRAGHLQLRSPVGQSFRVAAKLRLAAGTNGVFVLGVGNDPPAQLTGGTCGVMQPGDAVVMFWQQCNDAGVCTWHAQAGSDAACGVPDVPGNSPLPAGAFAHVQLAFDGANLRAELSVTPDGGQEAYFRLPVAAAAPSATARASLLFYAYEDAPTQDRVVVVEELSLTCSEPPFVD